MAEKLLYYLDDDSDDLATFLYVTKSLNIRVMLFSDSGHLLKHIRKCKEIPSAIIVDLNMPKVSGFQVLEQLSREPSLPKVPLIAFSTAGDGASILKAKEGGATCYMKKPRTISGFRQNLQLLVNYDWDSHEEKGFVFGK